MDVIVILILSIVAQLSAAVLALRLIRLTRRKPAWVLLAAGICLMTLRRAITLYHFIWGETPAPADLTAEWVALIISLCMAAGMAWIIPLFKSLKAQEEALRLNEARLEALWRLTQMTKSTLQELADFALGEGVRLTRSEIGYLGMLDEDGTILTIRAWSPGVMDRCAVPDIPLTFPLAGAGVWADAVRQRRPVVINQYATYEGKCGLPAGHAPIHRTLNLPVFDGDTIVAVAGVANKAIPYDKADVRQLSLLMHGMWRLWKRQRQEQALSEEIQRISHFQAKLIQTSTDGIIANDRQGNILIFNEGAAKIYGFQPEEVVGLINVAELYPPGVARQIKKLVYSPEYGGAGQLVGYETTARAKSGELIPIELSASLIYADGEEAAIVGFFRDLRERHQFQEKLLQAERLAALGQMAAHLGHEIKNPLMIIGGFARQVRDSLTTEPAKNLEKLQIILDEVHRLEDFLSEIGRYTRLSHPVRQLSDLNHLAQDTLQKLDPAMSDKKIRLHHELAPDLPLLPFDPELMRQAILNIAKNAIEAMPNGGLLTITTQVADSCVQLSIADNGEGIPSELMAKIFHPFYTTKARGSGLGLTIVQKIMEAHHGAILVDSQPQQGTRVTLTLPLITSAANSCTLPREDKD